MFLWLSLFVWSGCRQKMEKGTVPVSGDSYLYYEACGKGEALILLHGHSLDTRMWKGQTEAFAQKYRTICPDFRGYGKSGEQREDFQFTHADDIITLMDSLKIDKAHIVGLSMGAFVGADLLAIYPERMLSCVLASGGLRGSKGPSSPMDSIESAQRDLEIAELKAKGVDRMKAEWIESLIASGGSQKEKIRKALEEMIGDWSAWQALHKEARVIYGLDAEKALKERPVDVPTLIINGTAAGNRYSTRPRMLHYLSKGQVVLMEDCGHMLNMEKPEEFNRIVLSFLETAEAYTPNSPAIKTPM